MHALIEANREQLLLLAQRRGITGLRVFGSMVRGEARDDSDVDLLVTLAHGTSALALGGLLLDAQELLGRHVPSSPKRACIRRCATGCWPMPSRCDAGS